MQARELVDKLGIIDAGVYRHFRLSTLELTKTPDTTLICQVTVWSRAIRMRKACRRPLGRAHSKSRMCFDFALIAGESCWSVGKYGVTLRYPLDPKDSFRPVAEYLLELRVFDIFTRLTSAAKYQLVDSS